MWIKSSQKYNLDTYIDNRAGVEVNKPAGSSCSVLLVKFLNIKNV